MHLALLTLGLLGLVASVVMIYAFATAPFGYEDQTGYHPEPRRDCTRESAPSTNRRAASL
jgi:hypothetical protein